MGQPKKIEKPGRGHGLAPRDPDIFAAAANDDVDALEAALRAGVSVNAQDGNGLTPLHHAAVNRSENTLERILREPGVDATMLDRFNRNASFAALEVLGEVGRPVAERLRPFCYPAIFQDIERHLRMELDE